MKQGSGKEIALLGSGIIMQQLANLGLIDEYRLMVNPVVLGKGKLLFKGVNELNLKLVKSRVFKSGNVLLYYRPIKKK